MPAHGPPPASAPPPPVTPVSLRPGERIAAWVVTGPVGHLYAGVADFLVLLGRYAWARVRGRELG